MVIYPPIQEFLKVAEEHTGEFHCKSKKYYDRNYVDSKIQKEDLAIYEEFYCTNT